MSEAGERDEQAPPPPPSGALDAEYGARYADLYRRHWWWRAREEVVVREIRTVAREWGGSRRHILDVGCGDGLLFPRLSRFGEVEGVEPDARLITGQSEHPIHTVPFEDFDPPRRYALILMLDVLEHLADPLAALHRCRGLLEPGGHLLLTVPAFKLLWTAHDDLNHHFTRYRKDTLRAVVEEGGFVVEDSRYFFHWIFAAKIGVRLFEALGRGEASSPGVPPELVNRALYAGSRAEDIVLRPLRLPFGSSLLARARVR